MARDYVIKNPVIGKYHCVECGNDADVYQKNTKSAAFYTRECLCGRNESEKQFRQQKIWDNAVFFDGVTVRRPAKVEDKPETIINKEVDIVSDEVEEKNDESAWTPGDIEEQPEQQEKKGGKGFLAFGVVLLGAVAGVFM